MNILKSRTVWTFLALFAFNGLQAIKPMVPANYSVFVEVALTLLGIYFRANPQAAL